MMTLDGGRIGVAAQALAYAEAAIEECVKYVSQRKQFGKPLSSFQNTQFQLADMRTKVEASRLLVYRAAQAKQDGEPYSHLAAQAKMFASDTASDVTRRCLQLAGGYGYMREYPFERFMRDAKITEIYEGTNEVQKMVIAKHMGLK
jgi:butyryl-CoA dehydrogenase